LLFTRERDVEMSMSGPCFRVVGVLLKNIILPDGPSACVLKKVFSEKRLNKI
jgi:hypothetical protein